MIRANEVYFVIMKAKEYHYRITRFFYRKFFCFLVFILVGEVIVVEENLRIDGLQRKLPCQVRFYLAHD